MDERDVVVVAEKRNDLLRLAQSHQSMIDEHAGELVADRLVDQHRRDGAVYPAGEAADHPPVAHLRSDVGDLGLAIFRHRPVARQAADVADEIGEQPAAVGRTWKGSQLQAAKTGSQRSAVVRPHWPPPSPQREYRSAKRIVLDVPSGKEAEKVARAPQLEGMAIPQARQTRPKTRKLAA